jgi:hypothetical protein
MCYNLNTHPGRIKVKIFTLPAGGSHYHMGLGRKAELVISRNIYLFGFRKCMKFLTSAQVSKRKCGLPLLGGTFRFQLITEKVETLWRIFRICEQLIHLNVNGMHSYLGHKMLLISHMFKKLSCFCGTNRFIIVLLDPLPRQCTPSPVFQRSVLIIFIHVCQTLFSFHIFNYILYHYESFMSHPLTFLELITSTDCD